MMFLFKCHGLFYPKIHSYKKLVDDGIIYVVLPSFISNSIPNTLDVLKRVHLGPCDKCDR